MSIYIKRKVRFPGEIVHKRNTTHFSLGLAALCGVKANNVSGEKPPRMTTVSSQTTCSACIEIMAKYRAAAREKAPL